MKKKLFAALTAAAILGAASAFAAPVTHPGVGNANIDLGTWQVKDKFSDGGYSVSTDHSWNFTGGITYGVSDNWALQYQYHNMDASDPKVTGDEHEINAIYTFNPNISGFVGWNRITGKLGGFSGENNVVQVGVNARYPIAEKLDVYGQLAVGSESTFLWEAGLAYDINRNFSANLGYRGVRTDFDDVTFKNEGLTLGLTYHLMDL